MTSTILLPKWAKTTVLSNYLFWLDAPYWTRSCQQIDHVFTWKFTVPHVTCTFLPLNIKWNIQRWWSQDVVLHLGRHWTICHQKSRLPDGIKVTALRCHGRSNAEARAALALKLAPVWHDKPTFLCITGGPYRENVWLLLQPQFNHKSWLFYSTKRCWPKKHQMIKCHQIISNFI